MIQAEAQHRDHAIIEQVFADWNDGPLAHLPSGHFPANAAWLALAAICHNLTRAAGTLAWPAHARARGATIRRHLISVAARIARHGRGHITVHLPEGWHHEHELDDPLRGRLRPARRPGLTSPDPVTAPPHGPSGHQPQPPARATRTSRRTRQRQNDHAPDQHQDHDHAA